MSVFLLDPDRLEAIVTFAVRKGLPFDEAEGWLRRLYDANRRAVSMRYNEPLAPSKEDVVFLGCLPTLEQVIEAIETLAGQCEGLFQWASTEEAQWLNQLLLQAKRDRTEAIAEAQNQQRAAEARWEALGRDWMAIHKPKSAQAAIIANLQEDESDSMTDYFASKTVKTLFLTWCKSTRNNFKEMRKAASLRAETQHLGPGCGIWKIRSADYIHPSICATHQAAMEEGQRLLQSGELYGTTFDIVEAHALEHRETYSGGAGYYLARSKHSGWHVRKIGLDRYDLNRIAQAIGRELEECQQDGRPIPFAS